VSPFIRA